MNILSTRLGQLEVSEDELLKFPDGLPGFPDEKRFAFIPYNDESPFFFLQSVEDPNITFLVTNPFVFFANYEFELSDDYCREMDITDPAQLRVFNIITVPDNAEEMTANLLAPVVLNYETRVAKQFVLEKSAYTTRHRLFPHGFPQNIKQGGK